MSAWYSADRMQGLKRSRFRRRFRLDLKDRLYIEKKGLPVIRKHARDMLESRLGQAYPKKDGKQTPFKGHPVFKAQHATATCCRGCLAKWYGIPKGNPLRDHEISLMVEAVMDWIEGQLLKGAQRDPKD